MNTKTLIETIDRWIAICEDVSDTAIINGDRTTALIQQSMASAYWAVKQFVEVNEGTIPKY